ncbi:MAG: hypothetical protein R6V17_00150, partial [Halanaerobacter sp.]
NKFENHFLENFVDVATELLAYNKENSNQPTPSLNNFSETELKEQNIVITNQDADQILSILKELQEELEDREDKIQQLNTKIKKQETTNNTQKKEKERKNFKSELVEHSQNLDLITVLVQSGSNCCELRGNLFRVYKDFIILLDEMNDLIKIKITKIVAVKTIDPKKREKSYKNKDENKEDEQSLDNRDEEAEKNLEAV